MSTKERRVCYNMKLEMSVVGGLYLISPKTMVYGKMNITRDVLFPTSKA
jgi:hypothetical protein